VIDPCGVYFVELSDGRIKIGRSTNIRARLASLAAEFDCSVMPLGFCPSSQPELAKMERRLHRRFARHRIDGTREVFADCRAIRDYIKEHAVSFDEAGPHGSRKVVVLLTAGQYELIYQRAERRGLAMATYLRVAAITYAKAGGL
jgi:hypothetical protein